MLISLSE
ncbi:putative NTPase/helicase [Common midwife toad virus]|nr:putative NTPase/helicase [Common midwife toad virus]AIW68525.1 putative NTPase/helicase [common midwife toad virus-NL]